MVLGVKLTIKVLIVSEISDLLAACLRVFSLREKGRNTPCKRFGGAEVCRRPRNRSLPPIAHGFWGCLSLPDLRGAGYDMISAASAGKDMATHRTKENPGS